MKVRDLSVSNSIALKGAKEFNHLRIVNLDAFLSSYPNNLDYYASPFKIMADLEEAIRYENNPQSTIMIPYKEHGDVIFALVDIEEKDGIRIVQYQFATFAS